MADNISIIFSLIGTAIGGLIGYNTAIRVSDRKEMQKAAIDFHEAFLDALMSLDQRYYCRENREREGHGSVYEILERTFPQQIKAMLRFRSCGDNLSFEEITPLAISEFYASENHYSIKDAGEPATITCPSCGEDTYVLEDDICVLCEESVERECQRCGIDMPSEELDGDGYCGYCAHMMSKDD